jgi:hypothetical protein
VDALSDRHSTCLAAPEVRRSVGEYDTEPGIGYRLIGRGVASLVTFEQAGFVGAL